MDTKNRMRLFTLRISDEDYQIIHMHATRYARGNMSYFIRMVATKDSSFYANLIRL